MVREGKNWQRLVWEFLVIVVGVLVALLADEQRGAFADRKLERQYLARLEADLRQTRIVLDSTQLRLAGAARSAEYLESYLWGWADIPGDTATVVAALYRASRSLAVGIANVLPRTTFTELENTGRIGLIRSIPLRAAIQEYYTEVNSMAENLSLLPREYRDHIRRQLPPTLQRELRAVCPVLEAAQSATSECGIQLGQYDVVGLLRSVAGNRSVAGDLNLSRQQLEIGAELLSALLAETDSVLVRLERG